MKLMFEEAYELDSTVQEEVNESTGKTNKRYIIEGLFTTTEEKNKNGRIYPKQLFEKEVNAYQAEINENTIQSLMEYEHPSRSSIDIMEAVAKVESLEMKGNKVYGKAVLLDNPKSNQLKSLIDNGIKIGVSSRGLGQVHEGTVTTYKLICYDIVANPSNKGSYLSGLVEGHKINEGILEDKEYEILEDGAINEITICNEDSCSVINKQEAKDTLKNKLSEFLHSL